MLWGGLGLEGHEAVNSGRKGERADEDKRIRHAFEALLVLLDFFDVGLVVLEEREAVFGVLEALLLDDLLRG